MTNLSVRDTDLPRRRVLRAAVAAAAVVCTVVACSPVSNNDGGDPSGGDQSAGQDSFGTPADPAAVKQGGKLVIALSAEPDALDPTLSRSLYSRYVFHAMCREALRRQRAGAGRAAARDGPAHRRAATAGPSPSRCARA